jgi:nucleotide-binding universal stress UspA family protein
VVLLVIWITLAYVKREALLFVTIVMAIGLLARQLNHWLAERKGPKPSLLRQAIVQQLTDDAMAKPKVLLGTYGSIVLAQRALAEAKRTNSTLVVCFIRSVRLARNLEASLTMETDMAALRTFAKFLDLGHEMGVPVLPVYDSGDNAAELIAETAAITGCDRILIGTSRQGALYKLIKGSFHERLEELLPPEIHVEVLPEEAAPEQSARIVTA